MIYRCIVIVLLFDNKLPQVVWQLFYLWIIKIIKTRHDLFCRNR